jgi:hypothetical protein
MRRLAFFAVITLVHFAVSLGAVFGGLAPAGVASIEDGWAFLQASGIARWVLFFPLATKGRVILDPGHLTPGNYALLFMNSLIWGACAASFWSWWERRE